MVYNSNSRGRFHHSSTFRGRGGNKRFTPYGREPINSRFPPQQAVLPDNFEQSPSELQFPRPPQSFGNHHHHHDRRQGRHYHERDDGNGEFFFDTTAGYMHLAGSSRDFRGRNRFGRNFRGRGGRGGGGNGSGHNSPSATSFPDHTNSNLVQLGEARASSLSRKWSSPSVSHNRAQQNYNGKPPFVRGYTSPAPYQQNNQRYHRPSVDYNSSGLVFDPQDCDRDSPGIYHSTVPSAPMNECMRRSLFLRTSYKNQMDSRKVEDYFSEFGSVAEVLNLTSKNGVCYVVYFDWRDAQNAFDKVDRIVVIGGQQAEVMPSKLRPDAKDRSPCKFDHQATVLLSLVGSTHSEGFTDSYRSQLEKHGDLVDFYQAGDTEWVAEYYDIRAAKQAAMSFHGMPMYDGTVYTTFLWDGSVPKLESNGQHSSSHGSRSRSRPARHHRHYHHHHRDHDHSQNEMNDGGANMDDAIQRMANDPEVMKQAFAARDLLLGLQNQQQEQPAASLITTNANEGAQLPPLPTPTSLAALAKSAEQAMSVSTSKDDSYADIERAKSNGQLMTPSTSLKPVQAPVTTSHTDGINHLLGILAQVQKSSAGENSTKK